MESEKNLAKDEALAALADAWKKWHDVPGEDAEAADLADSLVVAITKNLENLGASKYEINRAEFLGTPSTQRQALLYNYMYERLLESPSMERAHELADELCKFRDEFLLKDPLAARWKKHFSDRTS